MIFQFPKEARGVRLARIDSREKLILCEEVKWAGLLRNLKAQNKTGQRLMTCSSRLTPNSDSRLMPPQT